MLPLYNLACFFFLHGYETNGTLKEVYTGLVQKSVIWLVKCILKYFRNVLITFFEMGFSLLNTQLTALCDTFLQID
jgi:hypothetical protein